MDVDQARASRVVFVNSISTWGGGERWSVETARALSERGHDLVIACAEGSALEARARAAGLAVFTRRFAGPSLPGDGLALGALLRERGTEVVVANVGRDVRIAAFACARSGAPDGRAKLVQRRGIARALKRDPFTVWLYKKHVARVVANCEAIRRTMLAGADFVDPQRFLVIPNGIDTTREPTGDRARLRRQLEIGEAPIVASIGRLSAMKGHAHLLRTWRGVRARVPGAVLLLAGEGDQEAALREVAHELDLGASVHFLGFRRDLDDLLAAIDLFVLPSIRDEGCNNALLEAMWYERAAVVTRCGGLPEQVVQGETGLVVEPGDEGELGEAIAGLLSAPETIARMGAKGRERVRERYALERVIAQWEELFVSLRSSA